MVRTLSLVVFFLLTEFPLQAQGPSQEPAKTRYDVFSFEQQLRLPGTPEVIYDAISGDIRPWWDHSFSGSPFKLMLEARPGGGFYEIFNERGDGALHATVIYADRGKMLRFDGPLGLSGQAIELVSTYRFALAGTDSTVLTLSVHGAGEISEGVPKIVENVWHHFLFERFKPYVESGKHLLNHPLH